MKPFVLLTLIGMTAWPQVAADANKGYKTKDGRDSVAKTLDNPNRDKAHKSPKRLLRRWISGKASVPISAEWATQLAGCRLAAAGDGRGHKAFGEDIQTDFLDRVKTSQPGEKLRTSNCVLGVTRSIRN